MKTQAIALLVVIALSLTACRTGRGELNFTTAPTIFRGIWSAQAKATTGTQTSALRLELTATFVDEFGYTVTGTLKFADDLALEVSGRVDGSGYETYLLARPPPSLNLTIGPSSSAIGNLRCDWLKEFSQKSCELSFTGGTRIGTYTVLNLVK